MKLMRKVLAVMVLMLCGGGLSAASEGPAPFTGPTQDDRAQEVLRIFSGIDDRDTVNDVSARNALYDEMRNGDRFNLRKILDSLAVLFPTPKQQFYRVYESFTPPQKTGLRVSFWDWIYWFFHPEAMVAYKDLPDDDSGQIAYKYCFDESDDGYRKLLEFRNKKLAMTDDERRDINAWNQRVNEGADLHSYFSRDSRIAQLIRDFANGRDFRPGHILNPQEHKNLKYIYDKCSEDQLDFLRTPSKQASVALRKEACAKEYADKAFNDCSEPVKVLITSKLDVLMRPELAESYVQALADGHKSSFDSLSTYSDIVVYRNLSSMIYEEKEALKKIERKANDERLARNQAEHEKKMKEFADQEAARYAELAAAKAAGKKRREELAADAVALELKHKKKALERNETELREKKEREEFFRALDEREAADSEKRTRNKTKKSMIGLGGAGVVMALVAMAIVPKRYKVSIAEVFSPLPKVDEFESVQDYRDTLAAIRSARSWLAGLGVLGVISALVAGYNYNNLESLVS